MPGMLGGLWRRRLGTGRGRVARRSRGDRGHVAAGL